MTRGSGSDARPPAARRAGRWLVGRYPSPWRARYEDEVAALLEDSRVRWRDVADLARGLLVERARALVEPADNPVRTSFLMLGAAYLAVFALGHAAWGLGLGARALAGPLAARWAVGPAVITIALVGAIVASLLRSARDPGNLASVQVRGGGYWLAAMLAGIVLAGWADRRFDIGFMLGWVVLTTVFVEIPWRPWQRARAAVHEEAAARHRLKWALMELARCETLVAQGAAAPIEEARTSVAEIQRSRDQALAVLRAMGYRARFHGGSC